MEVNWDLNDLHQVNKATINWDLTGLLGGSIGHIPTAQYCDYLIIHVDSKTSHALQHALLFGLAVEEEKSTKFINHHRNKQRSINTPTWPIIINSANEQQSPLPSPAIPVPPPLHKTMGAVANTEAFSHQQLVRPPSCSSVSNLTFALKHNILWRFT